MNMRWPLFAEELRQTRQARGYSVRKLGKYLNFDGTVISRYERAHPMSAERFLLLCQWMDADPMSYLETENAGTMIAAPVAANAPLS
jgi:transcriptional regulator with XRE-family HTH domain